MKSKLEELEGLEGFNAGGRIFGWGLTGVVLGLGLAAVALVFETYFAEDEPEDVGGNGKRPDKSAAKKPAAGRQAAKPSATKTAGKPAAGKAAGKKAAAKPASSKKSDAALNDSLSGLDGPLRELAEALDQALLGLGDDTERAVLRRYIAYKKAGANFACAAVRRTADEILVYLRLDPAGEDLLPFMRDVTDVGHIGTGDLELRLSDMSELQAARGYLARSYDAV